jgi:hypothetical protein
MLPSNSHAKLAEMQIVSGYDSIAKFNREDRRKESVFE